MTYRDELEAARARIEALEADNAALRGANADLERRLAGRDGRMAELCEQYAAAAVAWAARGPADERVMRAVEDAMGLADEPAREAFRREVANYAGALRIEGRALGPRDNPRLRAALEAVVRSEGL